jgi:protein-serine/threonine kinase
MERGDSGIGSGANTPGGGSGLLSRRSSKKEKEEKPPKEAKSSEGRPRAESNGYLSSGGKSEGMGAALNEFMRNKVSRKSSQTSNKGRSEDGRSSVGDGNTSAYGGSTTAGDAKSRASGGAGTSLLKKYGVCEKVAIGKGATAVVKLAHKWDRTTERLYAVKVSRVHSRIGMVG